MLLENFRSQKIIWDRANKTIFEKIEANSGDSNGRKLVVQVINQGVTENLLGTTLSLGWKYRKGAKGLDAFNVVDASKGIFEIYYTTEMLSNIGNIEASLILIDSTGRIESSTFTISVTPSTVDDESVESENSFTALTEALVKVNEWNGRIDDVEQDYADRAEALEETYAPRLTEVTAQLAQTPTKSDTGWASLNILTESERSKLLGLEPGEINAVLGLGNVKPENAAFFKTGKNKFDKNAVKRGYLINNSTGELLESSSWNTSEPMPMNANQTFTQSVAHSVAYYDSDDNHISTDPFLNNSPRTLVTPANTSIIRASVTNAFIDTYQIELGSESTIYEPFYIEIPKEYTEKHPFNIEDVPDKSITQEKVSDDIATKIKVTNLIPKLNDITEWSPLRAIGSIINNELTFLANQVLGQYFTKASGGVVGHKYYAAANVKATSNQVQFHFYKADGSTYKTVNHSGSGQYELLSAIDTPTEENPRIRVIDYRTSGFDNVSFKNVMLVDLTVIYGAGNEPTKDEFESLLRKQTGGGAYVESELVTNLINGQLLKPQSSESIDKLPLYLSYKNEELNVISKYDNNQDLRVSMKKRGGNNLFDFSGFYLIDNEGLSTSPSPSSGNLLFGVGTDFFAPYQIRVVNNIDGDYTVGSQFTGGNHAFDGGSTGTPTARTSSVKVFLDGRELVENEGYGTQVDAYWTNFIQGSNTKKENGTGREVLKENIHIHYDGYKWAVDNTIEVLEDLNWSVYYGLQAQLSVYNGYVFYHNAENRKWNDASVNSNSESKDCNKVTLYKDNNWLDVELDLIGLGKKEFNKNVEYGAFVSGGKVYFNLVNGTNILDKGDTFSFKGAYRFYSK